MTYILYCASCIRHLYTNSQPSTVRPFRDLPILRFSQFHRVPMSPSWSRRGPMIRFSQISPEIISQCVAATCIGISRRALHREIHGKLVEISLTSWDWRISLQFDRVQTQLRGPFSQGQRPWYQKELPHFWHAFSPQFQEDVLHLKCPRRIPEKCDSWRFHKMEVPPKSSKSLDQFSIEPHSFWGPPF
jgi:hypothetical protein